MHVRVAVGNPQAHLKIVAQRIRSGALVTEVVDLVNAVVDLGEAL